MKRYISMILVAFLLLTCMLIESPQVHASQKADETRAIAIVFDNSGSMYTGKNQAWCRATYAMEVFASMLNAGDTLQIYPMWPITVGGQEYTMERPFQITDASQASQIRDIFTADASGTPIESIDCAAEGLKKLQANKKYLIVLTDGGSFSKNGSGLSKSRTKTELDQRIKANAGKDMTVMYLGIDAEACMPDTAESEYFVKKKAANSKDVLSTLTLMCNQVFGRDTLPKNHISGKTLDFDLSMSKVIVFVQGENIANLKLTGSAVGKMVSSQQTQYSTKGAGDYTSVPDTSLQGMMVTYTNCGAGSYTIDYAGTATSIEVYYEPDADLDFVFTDAAGNVVDPNALYEGDYKVSFGMKDGKTGKLIASDLLGNPHYQGSYSVNGQKTSFTHDGYSGEVPVTLKMGDTFEAELTVTYLSGYTISKDSSDFGWPDGGIKVAARPAGELRLEISGGENQYSLQHLEEGAPYIAKIYYQGTQLTGDALQSVELKWESATSNADIKQTFKDDHYALSMHYKNPDVPQDTVCGPCTVSIYAFYTAEGSAQAQAQSPLTYDIKDDFSPLQLQLFAPLDYIVISELDDSEAMVLTLTMNGKKLTAEEFEAVKVQIDCGGIEHTVTPSQKDSAYLIKLQKTDGLAEKDYPIRVSAEYTDHIGRTSQTEDGLSITLSNTPLWLKWLIGILLLILLFIIIWMILHIRVLPSFTNFPKKSSKFTLDGEDVTKTAALAGSVGEFTARLGGNKVGISMPVKPGKESYLYKKQTRRYGEVKDPTTIKKSGNATIESVSIGSVKYVPNEKGVLERKPASKSPLNIKHGMSVIITGTFNVAGVKKPFSVSSKFNFKK